ncbi:hypothetical protein DXG01_014223 [Tephrocybe rancida]|nr:hypothetical protein DXG01_014223 [Tephrocybe rancida]
MTFLHNLETAALNAHCSQPSLPQFRDNFTKFRRSMIGELERISSFLRKCYDFSDKAACLLDIWTTCTSAEHTQYLHELIATSGELLASSQELVSLHQSISRELSRHHSILTSFFPQSKPPHITRASDLEKLHLDDTPLRDFVQSSIMSARPDGLVALQSTSDAIQKTSVALSNMTRFWVTFQETHHLVVNDTKVPVDIQGHRSLYECAESKDLFPDAIAHLAKIIGALSIEPVAARPKPESRRSSRHRNEGWATWDRFSASGESEDPEAEIVGMTGTQRRALQFTEGLR